jgi:DNA repair photolyase
MILSVSRRTDIPAFYSQWFYNRLKEGCVYVRNPMNRSAISKIKLNPEVIDCIVFWTKNPSNFFMDHLDAISPIPYYVHFTITPYDDTIEPHVAPKNEVIHNFMRLSEKIGRERVIWRYDPILLSDTYSIQYHTASFEALAKQLSPYTDKCIVSFVDFYKKCVPRLKKISVRQPTLAEVIELYSLLKQIADAYDLVIESCAESRDVSATGIKNGKCIDDVLIEKITGMKVNAKKDRNQRGFCHCIESIDIGEYNTCKHNCLYCYANYDNAKVLANSKLHNKKAPLLIGEVGNTDVIRERWMYTLLENSLFH